MDKFRINRKNAMLVVVDVQERLAAAMSEKDRVIANTLHLIEAARLFEIPVLVTEQYPKGLGRTLTGIADALPGHSPHEKITFSCCGEQVFLDAVESTGKKYIILTGMETHVCVLQTCIDLLRENYHLHVVADAVCSRTQENFRIALEYMRDAGAVITCTETVLFQLLEKAGSEEFKIISRRIK